MTEREISEVLAVLKVAYPQQLSKLSKADALATMRLWRMEFDKVPSDVLMLAVRRHIGKSEFFPNIKELKDELKGMNMQAVCALKEHEQACEFGFGTRLSEEVYNRVKYIAENSDTKRLFCEEKSLLELLGAQYDASAGEVVYAKNAPQLTHTE